METLKITLDYFPEKKIDIRVCGDRTVGLAYDDDISNWFTKFTGKKLELIRKSPNHTRNVKSHHSETNCREPTSTISPQLSPKSSHTWTSTMTQWITSTWTKSQDQDSTEHQQQEKQKTEQTKCSIAFANESQFLLVSRASVEDVKERVPNNRFGVELSFENFRPNLVIEGGQAYQEDDWQEISIGDQYFVASGPCNRCTMICVDKNTLQIGSEPLKTLGQYRRQKGKILFGVLFEHDKILSKAPYKLDTSAPIKVQKVTPHKQDEK